MFSSSPLKRLRETYGLEALPDTIERPAPGARDARSLPIERATVGDMVGRQGVCGRDIGLLAAVRELEARR